MRAIVLLCLLHTAYGTLPTSYNWNGPDDSPTTDSTPVSVCQTSDDFCRCCHILREVDRLKSYSNETLHRLEQKNAQNNKTLANIKAQRAAFSASLYTTKGFRCLGPKPASEDIIYEQVFLNLGNGYNDATGIFTAPFSGIYTFAFTIHGDSGSPYNNLQACAVLLVNGITVVKASEQNSGDQEDSATSAVVLTLDAGDKVTVNLLQGCSVCDNNFYNTFSGFLLYSTE